MQKILHSAWQSCPFHRRFCPRSFGSMFLTLAWLALSATQAQATTYALGTSALLVGPAAGSNSVVLAVTPQTGTWTATANANWLHLSTANQSGAGSKNVVFSYDVNSGSTRSGSLTIAGQMLTVTQAGFTYVAAPGPATVLGHSSLKEPIGVSVNSASNVYIADTGEDMIRKWTATNNSLTILVLSGLNSPGGVAADGAGDVYIADTDDSAIKKWTAANKTVTTLVSSGLNYPNDVALDGSNNVYIADSENTAIKKWTVANNTVSTLFSTGSYFPQGVAVDAAGNVYVAETDGNASLIVEWTAAYGTMTTLVSSGLSEDTKGVAVDGLGNVYIADSLNSAIKKWSAASKTVSTLISAGLSGPGGVAVDGSGNVYIADSFNNSVKELPQAFLDPTPKTEGPDAGNDALPTILPATENLLAPFVPTSDQSWLTISGITNGVVSFSFAASTSVSNRTAHITLLGQSIPVTQGFSVPPPPTVTSGPQGATLGSGNNGTLSVTASGGGQLTYQWQIYGTNIAGATNSTLNLGKLQLTNAGLYSVVVSNGGGAVTSAVAVLNIEPQLSAQLSNGNAVLSWPGPFVLQAASGVGGPYIDIGQASSPYPDATTNGQRFYRLRSAPCCLSGTNLNSTGFSLGGAGIPGCNFVIEASTNLVNWQPLQTNPSPFCFTDTNAINCPSRFYRAILAH